MTYHEKLRNPKWQEKRLKILERDGFKCVLCCIKSDLELHIHHEKYSGEPWEVEDQHLKTLCCNCHHFVSKIGVKKLSELKKFVVIYNIHLYYKFLFVIEGQEDMIFVFQKIGNNEHQLCVIPDVNLLISKLKEINGQTKEGHN
jgi:hypothetical protein